MIGAGTHGALTWVDLSTPDAEVATAFYRPLFGWEMEGSTTPMGEYSIGKVGDHQVGGVMEQGPELRGQPAVWTTFFYVDDIDAIVTRVEEAGGTVLEKPFEIPGDARIAVVADPTGAMLGLFGGPDLEGTYLSRTAGAVCWVELLTRDPAAAEPFYADVFGWKAETAVRAGTTYTVFKLDGEDVAGMMTLPEEVPAEAPAHWAVYFSVADCTSTERRAAELGGRVLRPSTSIEIGKFSVIADPHGAPFHLMEFAG